MEWIEVSARTLPAAVELALDRLGVVEAELEYEIVEEPKSGLFGLGRTEARIRARVKPLSREKPMDRRRRTKRGSESRSGGGRSRSATATAPASTDSGAPTRGAGRRQPKRRTSEAITARWSGPRERQRQQRRERVRQNPQEPRPRGGGGGQRDGWCCSTDDR